MRKIFFLSLLAFGFFSCKKDKTAPVIAIASPTTGQVYNVGGLVSLQAGITDNEGLHHVHIHVEGTDGSEPFHWEDNFDLMTFLVDTSFTINTAGTYTVGITAEDHAGNVGTEEVSITVN